MVNTKNKNIYKPLVVTGYVLFTLLVIGVLVSTVIPLGQALFTPWARHYNVTVIMIALTIGSLLPALLGYMIGDHAVKSKSRLQHHFNGVLFGLLAYWLMTVLTVFVALPQESFLSSLTAWLLAVNLLPSIGVGIITAALAIAHVRSKQAKHDILEYKPFGFLLIGLIVLLPIGSLVNNILTQSVGIYTFIGLIVPVVLGTISYVSLRKSALNMYGKVVWSAISVTVAYVATFVIPQLVAWLSYFIDNRPSMEFQATVSYIGWALALIGWGVFWSVQARALSHRRNAK